MLSVSAPAEKVPLPFVRPSLKLNKFDDFSTEVKFSQIFQHFHGINNKQHSGF